MKTAITGGIGSGKSYVCRLLGQHGIDIYDCDAAAKRLMRTSTELRRQLTQIVGPEAYHSDGQLDKRAIATFLLSSQDNAKALDALIHPAVAQDFVASGMKWMECAILFESGFDRLVDRVVVVTAPFDLRVSRIMQRDGITRQKAIEWINCQWPQDEVRRLSHLEIVNDGVTPLEDQLRPLLSPPYHQTPITQNLTPNT